MICHDFSTNNQPNLILIFVIASTVCPYYVDHTTKMIITLIIEAIQPIIVLIAKYVFMICLSVCVAYDATVDVAQAVYTWSNKAFFNNIPK